MTEQAADRRIRDALLLAARAEYASLPGEEEPELSPALRRKMRPLLADPFGRRRRVRRAVGRTAAAAVLALSVSFGALMAASPDARAWVQRMTVQLLEKYTAIRFAGESGLPGQLGDWAPTWLPDGYELTMESQFPTRTQLSFENAFGNFIDFNFSTSDTNFSFDNEHQIPQTVSVHGNPAYLLLSSVPGQESSLVWSDEASGVAFSLVSDLPFDNLIKIAESVEKK